MPLRNATTSRRRLLAGFTGLAGALLPLSVSGNLSSVLAAPSAPVIPVPLVPVAVPGQPIAPVRWLQNHRATSVFVDAEGSRVLAPAPQWSYFRIVGVQVKGRVEIYDPRTGAKGWIDATAVGPSGPPPIVPPAPPPAPVAPPPVAVPPVAVPGGAPAAGLPAPAAPAPAAPAPAAPAPAPAAPPPPPRPPAFEPFWIAPFKSVPVLLEPAADAPPVTLLAQFAPVQVKGPAKGDFYPVEEPFSKTPGWLDASVVGKVGEPNVIQPNRWWGKVIVDQAYGRGEPNRDGQIVAQYPRGTLVGFTGWSVGEEVTWDDPAWGHVAPGVYVYGRLTRPIPIDDAPPAPSLASLPAGKWIGINRTIQIVVAYVGDKPQFWARTSTGRPGWETPLGNFEIQRRVAKETMDSATLLGKDAERANYKIENVKYTQYFTSDGNAIHENWWKDPDTFGLPSSHGCAGLLPADALKFWEFGATGMPVIVHL